MKRLVTLATLGGVGVALAAATSRASGSPAHVDAHPDVPARALLIADAEKILARYVEDDIVRSAKISDVTVGGITSRRVTFGSNLAGVQFEAMGSPFAVHDVDVRFGVLLVRLAIFLAERDVTTVETLGIFPGAGKPDDCHNQGRAMDLSGVRRGADDRLSVLERWGKMPAPYAMQTATETVYRLHDGDPGRDLFEEIYGFATREGADRTDGYVADEGTQSFIGEHSFVITPDHPTPRLRLAHQDHFHIQIGPTRIAS